MHRLWKRLYRERRRLGIIAGLSFITGIIAFSGKSGEIFGIPFTLFAGFAFMAGLTPAMALTMLCFPKIRNTTESVSLSVMIIFLADAMVNGSEGPAVSGSTSLIGMMFMYLVFIIYGTPALDRYLPRQKMRFHSSASSALLPERLWPYVASTPDTAAHIHPEETILSEWIEEGSVFREVSRTDDIRKIEEVREIQIFAPPRNYRFRFVADAKDNADGASGTMEIALSLRDNGCRLTTIREYDRLTFRQGIYLWIDDTFGRDDDMTVTRAESARPSAG